jgi:hypothetical protein
MAFTVVLNPNFCDHDPVLGLAYWSANPYADPNVVRHRGGWLFGIAC